MHWQTREQACVSGRGDWLVFCVLVWGGQEKVCGKSLIKGRAIPSGECEPSAEWRMTLDWKTAADHHAHARITLEGTHNPIIMIHHPPTAAGGDVGFLVVGARV